jgi:hypothetical protein
LSPFVEPPKTTSDGAAGSQSAAVAQATAEPAGNSAQTVASVTPQLASATAAPQAQAALAATTPGPFTWLQNLINGLLTEGLPTPTSSWWGVQPSAYSAILKQTLQAYFGLGIANFGWSIGQQLFNGPLGTTAGAGGAFIPSPQFAALGAGGWTSLHPTASFAGATHIGGTGPGLSVPASWANGAPGAAEQGAGSKVMTAKFLGTPEGNAGMSPVNGALRGAPLAGGRGAQRSGNLGVRYGFRYSVLTRPPSAG